MEVAAEVAVGLTSGDLDHALEKHRKFRGNSQPKYQILKGSGSFIGTGTVAQFPIQANGTTMGPGAGYIWLLDSIITFAQDDHTLFNPTPGTSFVGGVYIGGSSGNLSLAELALPGLTFPGAWDFQDGQIVQHGESLVIATSAALATGQQIGANVWGRQYRVGDLLELSGR